MLLATLLAAAAAPLPAGIAPATCDYGQATAAQREKLKLFDFLVGDYSVTAWQWDGSAWQPTKFGPARWNGRYGLGGDAIIDDWWDKDPGLDPNADRGTNVRMPKPDGSWVMSWVSTHQYGVQHLVALVNEAGTLEMTQVYPERKGFSATFHRDPGGGWHRTHHALDKDGKRMAPIMLKAVPIPCPAAD